MNWFKENPFLSGLLAVTVVAAGVLTFLLIQSWTAFTEATDSYTSAVENLHRLESRVPFPNDENLKAVRAGFDEYKAKVGELRSKLAKMEIPVDDKVTPQMFQDALRAAVNGIREKAKANNVAIPEKFYLGFDQYESELPSLQATPQLNREMLVLQSLVTRLIDYKIQSLDEIKRSPLPQEESAAPQKADGQGPGKKPDSQASPVLLRYPVDLAFTAEQSKFRIAFNSLLGADQFLIPRSVTLQNSAPDGPSRKSTEPAAAPAASADGSAAPAAGAAPAAPAAPSLQIIFGRELVKADIRLEILDFIEPPAAKN